MLLFKATFVDYEWDRMELEVSRRLTTQHAESQLLILLT